jgi:pantetheine-phosphate adenylyltransferase
MKKIAVFPGSFSPFTLGHKSIVVRTLPLFDKLIIAIGINSNKTNNFPTEKNQKWIQSLFSNETKIEVLSYYGLTVDFCKEQNSKYIVRGVRDEKDFEFEKKVAQNNKELNSGIETLLITTLPKYSHISSTIVRDIMLNKGDISKLIPNHSEIREHFSIGN